MSTPKSRSPSPTLPGDHLKGIGRDADMPVIDLGNLENDLSFYSCFSLLALMTHPNNEEHRKQFIAKVAFNCKILIKEEFPADLEAEINKLVKSKKLKKEDLKTAEFRELIDDNLFDAEIKNEIYFEEIIDQAGGERIVSDSPPYEAVIKRSHQNPGRLVIAGEILFLIMQLEKNCPGKASVNLACHIIEHQHQVSKTTILKAWKEFKTVSHLWAAFMVSMWESEEDEDFMKEIDPFDPESLSGFLGLAEEFRKFGETNFPKGAKGSTLDINKMWTTPTGFPLKDWIYEPPDLTEEEIKIISCYSAPVDERPI